jgi:hypothetical protein
LEEQTPKPIRQHLGGLMEVYKLADKIVNDLYAANVYSEVSSEHLKDSIFEYLYSEYNKMINELSVYFELKKMTGEKVSDQDYELEFNKVKFKLLKKVEEISRSK